jgi:hypothetical protein
MKLTVQYFKATGELLQIETFDEHVTKSWRDDCAVAHVDLDDGSLDELRTGYFRVVDGSLRRKSEAELAQLLAPTIGELQRAIATELDASTWRAVNIIDEPVQPGERTAWLQYRARLRELAALDDAVAMLRAFPTRPDGFDAVAELRSRVKG